MTITPYVPATALSSLPTAIWSGVNGYAVLPYLTGQSPELDKAPVWNTKVVKATSGKERRTALRPYPLWQFNLQYEVIRHRATLDEVATFYEFFNTMQGMYLPFLYLDPSDNAVAAQPFATGDGTTVAFQLMRSINSWSEPVYAAYAPTIFVNGTAKTLGTDYTMTGNGKVTFFTAPVTGAVLTWTGNFYYLCRFDQDDLTLSQIMNLLWSGKGLKFTSIIP